MKNLLAVLLLVANASSLSERRRPNVVLMMVDDLGIGDLGCYGNTTISTPNIDRLAQEGVRLTQHIAAAPLCTPSRAAFHTGRYPIRSGMVGLGRVGVYIFSASSGGLPSQEVSFATIAKAQGYKTALIGKWHLGLNCERAGDHCHHPARHGFDLFYGAPLTNLRDCSPGHGSILDQIRPYVGALAAVAAVTAILYRLGAAPLVGRWVVVGLVLVAAAAVVVFAVFMAAAATLNCVLMRDQEVVEQPFVSQNLTQRMTREAVDFIERSSGSPFLLVFSFLQVHTATFASPPFQGTSRHGIYGDAIHEVDWSVGQLMETLDRLNLRNDTLAYLTSDHGAHLEEIPYGGSNGIYKSGKSTNWEGGIRVPGIISMPGTIPGGGVQDQPTSNMDLFPTVVELTGGRLPQDREIDGHDLMPLLQGRVERSEHEFLFHYCNAYLNAVRWHPRNSSAIWKAFYFTPNFSPENTTTCGHTVVCLCTPRYVTRHDPPLLYDLSRDPSETTALTPATEPAFHAVLAAMAEAAERHRSSLRPVDPQISPGNLVWKPWLQPCCSSLGQLCACRRDDQGGHTRRPPGAP